jgi:hypothetical protein
VEIHSTATLHPTDRGSGGWLTPATTDGHWWWRFTPQRSGVESSTPTHLCWGGSSPLHLSKGGEPPSSPQREAVEGGSTPMISLRGTGGGDSPHNGAGWRAPPPHTSAEVALHPCTFPRVENHPHKEVDEVAPPLPISMEMDIHPTKGTVGWRRSTRIESKGRE